MDLIIERLANKPVPEKDIPITFNLGRAEAHEQVHSISEAQEAVEQDDTEHEDTEHEDTEHEDTEQDEAQEAVEQAKLIVDMRGKGRVNRKDFINRIRRHEPNASVVIAPDAIADGSALADGSAIADGSALADDTKTTKGQITATSIIIEDDPSGDFTVVDKALPGTKALPGNKALPGTKARGIKGPANKGLGEHVSIKDPGALSIKGPGALSIKDPVLNQPIPIPPDIYMHATPHYLENRAIFIKKMNTDLRKKFPKLENETEISCEPNDAGASRFDLLTHQKIIAYYLNVYSPYRGLLLYHGLGSGKTCSSIAIAEGMKSFKKILVLTPASLRMNYMQELKKCGDPLYRKDQHWIFINKTTQAADAATLLKDYNLAPAFMNKQNGLWTVIPDKESNFNTLTSLEKKSLDIQINQLITLKYEFINYNGIRNKQFDEITYNGKVNPFDNRVVIIDEAHNLISRIVNKLKLSKVSRDATLAYKMYTLLMRAQNSKIVMLSGTPMINYPNEIGILFNILRGHIVTWSVPLTIGDAAGKITEDAIKAILRKSNTVDHITFRAKLLEITRTPFGFINQYTNDKYDGVIFDDLGTISDDAFIDNIREILKKHSITFDKRSLKRTPHTALPDTQDAFLDRYLNADNTVKNQDMLMRRIIGLTSFFKSAHEKLMPKYDINTDLIEVHSEMSDYQFGIYGAARAEERSQEKKQAKKKKSAGLYDEVSSTYRIFSRLFCNFVFPNEITRPMPTSNTTLYANIGMNLSESTIDMISGAELVNSDSGLTADDIEVVDDKNDKVIDKTYEARINRALFDLKANADTFLTDEALQTFSPKFSAIINNITAEANAGKHLLYSQFRTLEGIGIIKLILEQRGFCEFKIHRDTMNEWVLNIKPEDVNKPMFALYTGTETADEKEMVRNVFNDEWDVLPEKLRDEIQQLRETNLLGQLIKVFMITASGAEGISLKNVRFVHIMEPYWHPVRREQVIGRANRICSHNTLPTELRTIQVFLYLMHFSERQLKEGDKNAIELKLRDINKEGRVITTDEKLHETSNLKHIISTQLMVAIKQSSIDCSFHNKKNLVCYSFGNPEPGMFGFNPDFNKDEKDDMKKLNKKELKLVPQPFTLPNNKTRYIKDVNTEYFYDEIEYAAYIQSPGRGNFPSPVGEMNERIVEGKPKLYIKHY